MKNDYEQNNALELARKKRHLYLLHKLNTEVEGLNTGELKELERYEAQARGEDRAGRGRGGPAALRADQIIETEKGAAAYAGVTERTIRRWKNEKGMPTARMGGRDVYIRKVLELFRDNEGKAPSEYKLAEQKAQAEGKTAKARLLELELQLKQGQLVHWDDVETAIISRILILNRLFLALPRALSVQLAKESNAHRVAAILEDRLRETINIMAGVTVHGRKAVKSRSIDSCHRRPRKSGRRGSGKRGGSRKK